jgi:AbrB family looped-hinge helix DNA binding protein
MKLVKVTTNGRVTIPAELRKKYNLLSGRKLRFEIEERVEVKAFNKEIVLHQQDDSHQS